MIRNRDALIKALAERGLLDPSSSTPVAAWPYRLQSSVEGLGSSGSACVFGVTTDCGYLLANEGLVHFALANLAAASSSGPCELDLVVLDQDAAPASICLSIDMPLGIARQLGEMKSHPENYTPTVRRHPPAKRRNVA